MSEEKKVKKEERKVDLGLSEEETTKMVDGGGIQEPACEGGSEGELG